MTKKALLEKYLKIYEPVIGLEVHAQLKTKSKLFCACPNEFGGKPNSHVCPVCLGLPGVLPVLNEEALNLSIKAALALNLEINLNSKFDRKQYFYPDLPKGYQISQYDKPIAEKGKIFLTEGKSVRIMRIHLEEDAGKLVHAGAERLYGSEYSLVDYNRAGTPLIEIVSEPDIYSAEQAKAYVQELRLILLYTGVCDGNLEEGSLRCDVNISLRKLGTEKLGTRAEIKNINSFRSIEKAIQYEIVRQAELLEEGQSVVQETRLWLEEKEETSPMRKKEDLNDYRYFPDPDLREVSLRKEKIELLKRELPVLPAEKRTVYREEYNLNKEEASILVADPERGRLFEEVLELTKNPKKSANWVSYVYAYLKENKKELSQTKVTVEKIAQIIRLIQEQVINESAAKEHLFPDIMETEESIEKLCTAKDLKQITDLDFIRKEIKQLLEEFPEQTQEFKIKEKQKKLLSFLMGKAIVKFKSKVSPQTIKEILEKTLDRESK